MRRAIATLALFCLAACGSREEKLSPWEVQANRTIASQLGEPLRLPAGRTPIAAMLSALPPSIQVTMLADGLLAPTLEIDHGTYAISGADALDEIVLQASPKAREQLSWEVIAGEVVIGAQTQLADPAVRARLRAPKKP